MISHIIAFIMLVILIMANYIAIKKIENNRRYIIYLHNRNVILNIKDNPDRKLENNLYMNNTFLKM